MADNGTPGKPRRDSLENSAEYEHILRDVVEFLPDPTAIIDLGGRVIAWNKAAEEITGIKAADMLGKSNHEYTIPFYGCRRPALVDLVLKPDEAFVDAYAYIEKRGEKLFAETFCPAIKEGGAYFLVSAGPVFDPEGNIIGATETLHETTKFKQTERELSESKQRMADIIDFLPDATLVIDKAGRVIAWNHAMEEMTGVQAEDMLGKGDYEYTIPFYGKRQPALIDLVFEADEVIEKNYSFIKKENGVLMAETAAPMIKGKEAVLWGKAVLLYDTAGNIVGAIESVRDITEQKKTDLEIRKSEERYRQLIETSNEGIWMLDTERQTTFVNRKMANMLGYTPDEMIGTSLLNYLYDQEAVVALEEKHLWTYGGSGQCDLKFRRKDGTELWAILSLTTIYDGEKYHGILGMVTDITERKLAEIDLKESRQRTMDVIDFLPDASFVIDMAGKVIIWNQAIAEMTGVPAKDVLGKGDYEYALPFYGKRRPILIDLVFKSDEEIEQNYRFITREQEVLIAETSAPLVKGQEAVLWGKAKILYDTHGNKVGAIESIRDVTDRIRAENRLKQSYADLKLTLEGTVNALSTTTEKKDPYTAGHQQRVSQLAWAIGLEMGLDAEKMATLLIAGKTHDIGKIGLPIDMLSKPGKLDELERAVIMTHAHIGYEIVRTIPFNQPVADIVLQHHERADGSGYPLGLTGPQILLEASIIAVADVVEAMASHRPYRPALGVDAALQEITEHKGTLYDEIVVECCLKVFRNGFSF